MQNDMKNFFLASFTSSPAIFVAVDTMTLISVVSAVLLPILFFTVGKTIDVMIQIHLQKKDKHKNETDK